MTKVITAFIIIVVCWCGYHFVRYWAEVQKEQETEHQQAAGLAIQGESLPGLPYQLNESLQLAQQHGTAAMREWLKTYGPQVADPRKAWIEMDFCVAIAREDPAEARRIFKSVKDRISPSSPVWPRVKQLEKSFK